MTTQIQLGGIAMDVMLKDIKNIHLRVYPPTGHVRISAPLRMSLDTILNFVNSKLEWIKQQQIKLRQRVRETPSEFVDGESHYVWGQNYLLELVESPETPDVELKNDKMLLRVRPDAHKEKRREVLDSWYRAKLRQSIPALIEKWEPIIDVKVKGFYVQRMKTRWGSCNLRKHTIRLNTDLARKPPECLEYVTIHEMVHLLEPTHNFRFYGLMDRFMPKWQVHRAALNRLPMQHEAWEY